MLIWTPSLTRSWERWIAILISVFQTFGIVGSEVKRRAKAIQYWTLVLVVSTKGKRSVYLMYVHDWSEVVVWEFLFCPKSSCWLCRPLVSRFRYQWGISILPQAKRVPQSYKFPPNRVHLPTVVTEKGSISISVPRRKNYRHTVLRTPRYRAIQPSLEFSLFKTGYSTCGYILNDLQS